MTDSCSKEVPVIEVEVFISGDWVCRIRYQLFVARPFPEVLILDNCQEFAGHALESSALQRGITQHCIQPGKQVHSVLLLNASTPRFANVIE